MKQGEKAVSRIMMGFAQLIVFIGLLVHVSPRLYADLPRTAVGGAPRVGSGQEVERFVLMEAVHRIHLSMFRADSVEYWMLPGQFIPVSEDAEGVFYQAASGFLVFQGSLGKKVTRGGLYVSKTRRDRIWPYLGDAADLRESLNLDRLQLLLDVRQKLRVARAERKR